MDFDLAVRISTYFNYLSIVSCTVALAFLAFKTHSRSFKATLQVRLGIYLITVGLLYSCFQIFTISYTEDTVWCSVAVWGWIFFQNTSVFFTISIAHNIQVTILQGKLREQQKWERIYFIGPIVISLILAVIPWIAGVYGYDPVYNGCWVVGDHYAYWLFGVSYFFVITGCAYSMLIVLLVIAKISRKKDQSGTSTGGSHSTNTNRESVIRNKPNIKQMSEVVDVTSKKTATIKNKGNSRKERKIAARIFNILAPYSLILLLCQISSIVDLFWKSSSRTGAWNIFDFSSSAIQGFLYTVLVLRNPNILSYDVSTSDLLEIILGNEDFTSTFMAFLKTLLCEENLQFYIDAQEFKYVYLAEELNNTFNESMRLKSKIHEKYFKSTNSLNIPHNLQKTMEKLLESNEISSTMFDEVIKHIKMMMSTDSIPKFIRSAQYKGIEEKVRFERIKRRL